MKPKISLHKLFLTLLSPISARQYDAPPEAKIIATTVRLEPDVRRYYEDAANALGISLQSIIKITLTGLMKISQKEVKTELNLMIDRFFELFSAHHIASADIPKFLLPHKVPLSALANNDRLLDLMEPALLEHISALFNVNLKWLKGLSSRSSVLNKQRWYKAPGSLCSYLNELSHNNINPEVIFVSDSSQGKMYDDRKSNNHDAHVGIIIKIPTKSLSGIAYDKFEMSEFGPWGYEKTRIDLKLVMMFCVRNNFYLRGIVLNKEDFDNLFHGYSLPITAFEKKLSYWEPIDYVSAGYTGDKDTDELLNVVRHYCTHRNIKENCDGKGRADRTGIWHGFSLNLDQYSYKETQSINELLNDYGKGSLLNQSA